MHVRCSVSFHMLSRHLYRRHADDGAVPPAPDAALYRELWCKLYLRNLEATHDGTVTKGRAMLCSQLEELRSVFNGDWWDDGCGLVYFCNGCPNKAECERAVKEPMRSESVSVHSTAHTR